MLSPRHLAPACLLLLLAPLGPAEAQPATVAAEAYVSSGGYASIVFAPIAARIDGLGLNMTPPEVAALLLEARESKNVWRMRTIARVERRTIEGTVFDLVEIERYNLGPALRADALRTKRPVPEAEAFGVGPSVGWRVVTRPDGPLNNVVVAAGRRDYAGFEAGNRDCAGLLCTSVETSLENHGEWKPVRTATAPPAPSPEPAIITHTDGKVDVDDETTTHALRELALLANLANTGDGFRWVGPPPGERALLMIDNELSDGSDGIAGPVAGTLPPRYVRRTVVANPGPTLTVDVSQGTLKKY